MTGKEASILQEKSIAKLLNGYTTINSGGTKFGGGDVLTKHFFIEAKTVTKSKDSFSIKKDWIKKAKEQAYEQGLNHSALAFRYDVEGEDYFVISDKLMKMLVDYVEREV